MSESKQSDRRCHSEVFGEIRVSINLVVPADLIRDNNHEKIAAYLNEKLYKDPEFFGDFGPENIKILGILD